MAILANVPDAFHLKHRFIVEIGDFQRAGFTTCTEIKISTQEIDYYEGGSDIPVKLVGRVQVPNVTLTRGATADPDLYQWFKEVANVVANTGRIPPHFKRDIDVVQLSRQNDVERRWTLVNAFPSEFVAGEWNNDEDGVVMESVTIRYDYPKQPTD
jgi:phage tail-like protein